MDTRPYHHPSHPQPPTVAPGAPSYPQPQPPNHHIPQPPLQYSYPPPANPQTHTLPPIHSGYAHSGAPTGQHNLPPLRHPHDPVREGAEYHSYNQHNQSGHATPAPVNRSYSVDSAHHQRTPTTPAHPPGPYPSVSGPDGAPAPPPAHNMEHAHPGYPPTNGIPHGLPPPHYHPEAPQHHYATPVMDNHHGYGPPPPPGVPYSQSYGPTSVAYNSAQAKKKHMRATQACEQCRQRKQKCDEGAPCSFCKENNLNCQYRDTPPAKTDKNMERVLQLLEINSAAMDSHTHALTNLTNKFEGLEHRLQQIEQPDRPMAVVPSPPKPHIQPTIEPEELASRPKVDSNDHRTAPHKLVVLWPSISRLWEDAGVELRDSYVMEAEDRGIIKLHTRGEGIDEYDGTQHGVPASPASEESGEGNTPSPPEGLWGTGFPNTPAGDTRKPEAWLQGGLRQDGSVNLDVNTIRQLHDSYMKHIHVMHPFLDKGRLRKLVDRFIKRNSPGQHIRHKFAVDSGSDQERPLKRQRSNVPNGTSMLAPDNFRREATERSPGNAIVWLVLALGKICMHLEPLPGPVPDGKLNSNTVVSHQMTGTSGMTNSSPVPGAVKPSPMSPTSTPMTQRTPPTTGPDGVSRVDNRSRRSSFDGSQVAGPRNQDVVPGLAYYAKATEILGEQVDGNDLVHAQMFLLAGLYKGQLARVKESMSWFQLAGRATLMLLDRYKLYNDQYWTAFGDVKKAHETSQSQIKDKRHSLIVLASWTVLQLESDILAELRFPHSGINMVESMLLMPHNQPDDEKESYEGLQPDHPSEPNETQIYDRILIFYTAQTFLRRRLNQIHKELYGDGCLYLTLNEVREVLSGHEKTIGDWRDILERQRTYQWDDNDPPPTDILEARLRAKYWGAKYVINRPFLDYALHIMPHLGDNRTIESVAKDVHGNPRHKAEIHLFKAIQLMGENEIWAASQRCIEAAMQSTIAFDGVADRLVVTNIHGTAHAQFGNMLVLSAAYYNPVLNQLVPAERFQRLLQRTIKFLRRLTAISPTCTFDCSILERISKLLFGKVPTDQEHMYKTEIEPMSASNSFGPST